MAKYSTFKYGTTKYGAGAAGPQPIATGDLVWILQISWDGSTFGPNEAQYMSDLSIKRGREHYITSTGGNFEPMQPGQATFVLENIGGRYDPYNSASALYPNVKPGRRVRIGVRSIATGTTYTLFSGKIENIVPIGGSEQVEVVAVDDLAWLNNQDVTVGESFNLGISTAIGDVLNAAGFTGGRSIQADSQPLYYFSVDDNNAAGVLQTLADACLGTIFFDVDGNFRFYTRGLSAGMTTHTIGQAELLKSIEVSQPWDNLRNHVTVYANRWVRTSPHTVWTAPGQFSLAVGASATEAVTFYNPTNPVQPEQDIDYIVSDRSNGSNTISGGVSVTLSDVTTRGLTITVTNTSSYTIYVRNLRIRGREYLTSYPIDNPRGWNISGSSSTTNVSTKVQSRATDATSIADVGRMSFVLDNQYMQDKNYSAAFATALCAHLKDAAKNPVIQIETRPTIQFPFELMDKITLTSAKLGINETYFIGGIEHRWTQSTGQGVTTTLWLHDCLEYGDAITAEGLNIVDIPEIPQEDAVDWYGDPVYIDPIYSDPQTAPCKYDTNAAANGWYTLNISGDISTNVVNSQLIKRYPMVIRSAAHTYQTQMLLIAYFMESDDNGLTWHLQTVANNTYYRAIGLNKLGTVVATANFAYGGLATFTPAQSVQVEYIGIEAIYSGSSGTGNEHWVVDTEYVLGGGNIISPVTNIEGETDGNKVLIGTGPGAYMLIKCDFGGEFLEGGTVQTYDCESWFSGYWPEFPGYTRNLCTRYKGTLQANSTTGAFNPAITTALPFDEVWMFLETRFAGDATSFCDSIKVTGKMSGFRRVHVNQLYIKNICTI